ncbi:MAG: MetQ/NlpA family ABC transporter substrate-binding protein [Kyrpidia sp.]|nr:MetQ/NlpA family ABC transporter substrate-binding protein [Kyrpidia sp.]
MSKKNWIRLASTFLTTAALLIACSSQGTSPSSGNQPQKEIRIGFNPGPYTDLFRKGVQPYLEQKGYTVKILEFSDWVQPNFALANQSIDANVYQHTIYLENFNKQHHLNLIGVVHVPTAPMGIYSSKHRSLNEVKDGMTVSIPNDPTNQARALLLLQKAGWVSVKKNVDPIRVSEHDVEENPKHLKLLPMEAAQLPRSKEDVDYAVITGNFAISSGLKLTDALLLEDMLEAHLNVVAVRSEDRDKPFAKDLVDAYRSSNLKKVLQTDPQFAGYALPKELKE